METDEKKEDSLINKIDLPQKICQSSCNICNSNCLKEIHLLRENGVEFLEIVKICKEKYNFKTSNSSLCTHFQNYTKLKLQTTSQIMQKDLVDDAMKRAVHATAVVTLIDKYLVLLEARIDSGMGVNVADFERLMNIRYKLLEGGSNEDEKNLTVVFNNAIEKYKVELAQPALPFPDEPQAVENSSVRNEEDLVGGTLDA